MKARLITFITIVLSIFASMHAQSTIVVEAVMDSSVLWVGEQTMIHLSLTQPQDDQVIFPEVVEGSQLIGGVEVVRLSQPDTTQLKNNRLNIQQDILVTSFDSGFYYIPPFKYIVEGDTVKTQSLSLKVVPVQVAEDAQASDMYDIKDVVEPPFHLFDFVPKGVVWALLIIVVVLVVVYFFLKYYKPQAIGLQPTPEPQIPPYDKAIQELQSLRDMKLWQQGQDKLYYTRLVDILREYIDGRFDITAMEMTSSEIMSALARRKEAKEVNKYLNEVLSMADFVKFAKMRPLPDDNEQMMRRAYDFVELTKPQPEEPQQPENIDPSMSEGVNNNQ